MVLLVGEPRYEYLQYLLYLQGPVVPTISGSGFPLSICHRIVFMSMNFAANWDPSILYSISTVLEFTVCAHDPAA